MPKKKKDLTQSLGVILTPRQFKAFLINNIVANYIGTQPSITKQDALNKLDDFEDVVEKILEDCILEVFKD